MIRMIFEIIKKQNIIIITKTLIMSIIIIKNWERNIKGGIRGVKKLNEI